MAYWSWGKTISFIILSAALVVGLWKEFFGSLLPIGMRIVSTITGMAVAFFWLYQYDK